MTTAPAQNATRQLATLYARLDKIEDAIRSFEELQRISVKREASLAKPVSERIA